MSKYFCHGIQEERDGISIALQILKQGKIKTKKDLRFTYDYGFNGLEHVSVCKKEEDELYQQYPNNAYQTYIYNHFCFLLREDLPAEKPIFMGSINLEQFEALKRKGNQNRYTDMIDEWQVYGSIPLSYVVAIGIPIAQLEKEAMYFLPTISFLRLKNLFRMARKLGLDIIDSSEEGFLEKYEQEKERLSSFQLKLHSYKRGELVVEKEKKL